jgi:hypothetical protein
VVSAGFSTSSATTFDLAASGLSTTDLQSAIGYWSGCSGYGTTMPSLRIGGSGGLPIVVQVKNARSTASNGSCGESTLVRQDGRLVRVETQIWTQEADGTSCVPLADVLAHELGHVYGLSDASDPACDSHIMGVRVFDTRTVFADDCDVARQMWITPLEVEGPESPTPSSQVGGSPLVIDLDRRGFRFTDAEGGVNFDLDTDGIPERIAWLAPGSRDGFLVLDRNQDGEISSGAELFGDWTPQPATAEPNGFLALAVFDEEEAGGNRNRSLDPGDAIFQHLRLWIDEDHDGRTQDEELHPLASLGLRSIGLDYLEARSRDRHGNQLRYRSLAQLRRGVAAVVDVFLLRVSGP